LIADSDRIERQFLDGVGRSFAMVDSIRPAHPMSAIRSSRGPAAAGISCLLVLGSAFSTRAAAEAWLVQPTVAFSTQYEDNIRLDSDEQDAAWTNIPTLQALVSRQTETLDVRALGRFRYRAYESSADLEDSGQELARLGSEYRTERSVFGLDASWRSQDSLADRGNFDSDLPGDIDDSDADSRLLQVQVTRNRGDIVPSYAFQWSERTQIGAELAYQTQNYDDAGTTIQLTEYEQYRLALNHRYRLDERTMWTNTLRATDYEANKAERTYDTNEILTGVSRAFTERVRLGFQVGWRKTEFDTPADQGSNNGYTIQLTGALSDELSELSGRLSHQLVPSSSGEVVEQDEADDQRESGLDDCPECPADGSTTQTPMPPWFWWSIGGAALMLILLIMPALRRQALRRRRTRLATASTVMVQQDTAENTMTVVDTENSDAARSQAHAAWDELIDTMIDYRLIIDAAETPRTTAERLVLEQDLSSQTAAVTRQLGHAEERARYSQRPVAAGGLMGAVADVRKALASRAGRWVRLIAVVLPPSVVYRWRSRAAAFGIKMSRKTSDASVAIRRVIRPLIPRRRLTARG
jgi:hypothetical protein